MNFQDTSDFVIYSGLGQFGPVSRFWRHYGRWNDSYVYMYVVNMKSASVEDLKHHCQNIADAYSFELNLTMDYQSTLFQWPIDIIQSMDSIPTDQKSKHQIQINSLNDDCLRYIFDLPDLSLADLMELTNTCERFNRLAKIALRKKYVKNIREFGDMDLWQAEKFFRQYGELIVSVDLSQSHSDDIMLQLVTKYCANIINLVCRRSSARTIGILRHHMVKLHEFTIEYAGDDFPTLFQPNIVYPLQKLRCRQFSNVCLPSMKFPQLTDVEIDTPITSSLEDYSFFSVNPQIREFTLRHVVPSTPINHRPIPFHVQAIPSKSRTVRSMRRRMRNIEDIVDASDVLFLFIEEDMDSFDRFEHLRKLHLNVRPIRPMTPLILGTLRTAGVHLESLTLDNIRLIWPESLVESICQMTSITSLHLKNADISDDILNRLLGQLVNLKCISFDHVNSLRVIYNALQMTSWLERAKFTIRYELGNAQKILNQQSNDVAAIATILQGKKIDLQITVELKTLNNKVSYT